MVDAGAHVVGKAGDVGPGGVLAVGTLAAAALAAALGVRVHCAAQTDHDGNRRHMFCRACCHDKVSEGRATASSRKKVRLHP